jgi:hypothetical protein
MAIQRNIALGMIALAGSVLLSEAATAGPGDRSRQPICSSFAKNAERWDNIAKGQGCRLKNDKDERGYFNWCMNTSDADFRVRSPVAAGHKAGREKECSQQMRRPIRL